MKGHIVFYSELCHIFTLRVLHMRPHLQVFYKCWHNLGQQKLYTYLQMQMVDFTNVLSIYIFRGILFVQILYRRKTYSLFY